MSTQDASGSYCTGTGGLAVDEVVMIVIELELELWKAEIELEREEVVAKLVVVEPLPVEVDRLWLEIDEAVEVTDLLRVSYHFTASRVVNSPCATKGTSRMRTERCLLSRGRDRRR